PRGRAHRRREPPGPAARRAAGDPGDELAAPRRTARPEAHPLPYLLRRLSGAGSKRRAAAEPAHPAGERTLSGRATWYIPGAAPEPGRHSLDGVTPCPTDRP